MDGCRSGLDCVTAQGQGASQRVRHACFDEECGTSLHVSAEVVEQRHPAQQRRGLRRTASMGMFSET